MKQISNWKLTISTIFLIIVFIGSVFDFIVTTLLSPANLPFLLGGILGTIFACYFGLVIPARAIFELKQMRKN